MIKKLSIALSALMLSMGAFAQAASAPVAAASPGFFGAIFGFFAGLLITWPALAIVVVLGVIFEHNEAHGFATFLALVAMVTSYFLFHVSLLMILYGAIAYIVIGLVWSFYRYKRHADKVVARNEGKDRATKERALEALHPKNMLSSITAWILIWPFSVVENAIGDIINAVQLLVTKFFRGVYHRVYDSAVNALK